MKAFIITPPGEEKGLYRVVADSVRKPDLSSKVAEFMFTIKRAYGVYRRIMALVDQAATLAPGGRVRLVEVTPQSSAADRPSPMTASPHTPEEIDAANGDEQKLGPKPIFFGGNTRLFGRFRFQAWSYQQTRWRADARVLKP
ncbi:hypothetical protein ACVXG7_09285 [Enterobacter hormaechei]